ncbi:virulence-associated E family protein [Gracilibacillus sp. YIM 98692]|uniref:virulence-associated E family protein n=1 Tax=Gracilibacillus sp. YIM 98692 TaxID=2663532 RepID=UPI0013D032DC|nr:virulence-associated E family protein [Gracilibacillus sp. YIM 98692]
MIGGENIELTMKQEKKLTYDRYIHITEYKSIFNTTSFTKEVTYGQFINKFIKPKITNTKGGAGCFIGGKVIGSRTNKNVISRSLVTLDIDNQVTADGELVTEWIKKNLKRCFKNSYVIYSTHNSTVENPRYRLIIPLAKDVDSITFQLISKFVVEEILRIDVDVSSFKPSQAMYYPTCVDGENYEFYCQDTGMVNPEDLMEEITSSRKRYFKKGDPRKKKNWIGAWCNVYSVIDVLKKFLSDTYKPVSQNRYTYTKGSSEGGLVVYDNQTFIYSFHASDPISGKCLNAFDLLRLTRFGDLDKGYSKQTPIHERPSYLKMIELCKTDSRVLDFYSKLKNKKSKVSWEKTLELDQRGNYKNSRLNMLRILKKDKNLKDIGRLNEFSGENEIYKKPPWRKNSDHNFQWAETDEAQLRNYFALNYGIEHKNRLNDCLTQVFYENSYHPIKEYLSRLKWDGKPRLDTVFIDYLGAKDNLYSRTVTKKMLVAAVARIFKPGIKFDYALVLIGAQGINKSLILKKLGRNWFNESLSSFKGDDAFIKIRASWIVELAELSALKNSELEEAKSFISAQEDIYRPKYQKNVQRFPRQCVFFGTTNNVEFLNDITGGRRFWPLTVKIHARKFDPHSDLTDEIIDQIWAEAYFYYKKGEKLYLDNEEVVKEALDLQEEHTTENGMMGIVEEYISNKNFICAREIWNECLNYSKEPTKKDIREINDMLRKFGWTEYRGSFKNYGLQRGFKRN